MWLTQAEAKTKWCPMVRVGVTAQAGGPSGINDPTVDYHGNCIASDCAMWRHGPAKGGRIERRHWFSRLLPDSLEGFGENATEPPESHRPTQMPYDDVKWTPKWDDGNQGAWVETEEAVARRKAELKATRKGWCGLAGSPAHGD